MRRRYYEKDNPLFSLIRGIAAFYVLYLLFLYFSNRADFRRWLIYSVIALIFIIISLIIWYKLSDWLQKRKEGEQKVPDTDQKLSANLPQEPPHNLPPEPSHTPLHSDKELMWQLQGMKPDEFESYVAGLFEKLGYNTRIVGGPHDKGIDVIAKKDGIESFIQCKRYTKTEVSAHAIRDFYGAIADDLKNGGEGYIITIKEFTNDARKFAEGKPIKLVNGRELIRYIRLAEENSAKASPAIP